MSVLLTHEPVVNKSRAITANRLVVDANSMADVSDGLNAIAEQWPLERTVLLSLGRLAPDDSMLEWSLPENTLLEFPARQLADSQGAELARKLSERGLGLCAADYRGEQLPPDLALRFSLVDVLEQPRAPRGAGLPLAVGLSNAAGFDTAVAAGYAGATGWFFLNSAPSAKKLMPGHAQIVRLLNLVRNEAPIKDIEAALKQDVALSFKLLRYINSAGFGLLAEVQSFRHAVTMLGYDKLNKWLSLLLVTASKDPGAPAIMQAAIVRGRLMEQLGQGFFDKSELDNLFIVGAFSLLDVLLGAHMEAVLAEMHLPEAVCDALTGRGGIYMPFLELARASEANPKLLAIQAEGIGVTAQTVNRAQLTAISFANTLQA